MNISNCSVCDEYQRNRIAAFCEYHTIQQRVEAQLKAIFKNTDEDLDDMDDDAPNTPFWETGLRRGL